ncbi:MAG: hypothetical protein GY910_08330 [bacterium]|nr:hypothetical protein [bacterium]
MIDRPSENTRLRPLSVMLALVMLAIGCGTPDGPHHPIPDQSLSIPAPEGMTRILFINVNYRSEGRGSGPVRIQLGGKQIPSVWPERYIQAFVEPGEYDLVLEQTGWFSWSLSHPISVKGDEILVSVRAPTFGLYPVLEILDELPSDFDSAFRPGRHPKSW